MWSGGCSPFSDASLPYPHPAGRLAGDARGTGWYRASPSFLPLKVGLIMCLPLPCHLMPIITLSWQGGGGGQLSLVQLFLCYQASASLLTPAPFLLQMEPHLEEAPGALGPDLLTVRKTGVSRTHSLPNDSYMCRDRSTAEGSLGRRSWGLPKAQSGTTRARAGQFAHAGGPRPLPGEPATGVGKPESRVVRAGLP